MKSNKKPARRKPSTKKPAAKKPAARKTTKPKKPAKSLKKQILKLGALLVFLMLLGLFALFGAVYIGLFGALPDKDELIGLRNSNASEIFASDGTLLGKFFIENRSSIGFDDIPQIVVNALVATEDSRFFEHEGIDLYSIPRVVIKSVILGDKSGGGGSTISQQLIKNLFGRSDHGALSMPVNKLKENVTALKLEEMYSKEEIITLYLNTVSFGENVYGIKAASQRFFSKDPRELSLPEAATLVGMLKANTSYNPRLHPEAAKERRNTVLALMVREGFLEPEALHSLLDEPVKLRYQRLEGSSGPAPYFRAFAEKEIARLLEELGTERGEAYDLYRDGLKITTTLHAGLQAKAEESFDAHMKKLQAQFDSHWQGSKPWGSDEAFLWKAARQSKRYQNMERRGATEADIDAAFRKPVPMLMYSHEGMKKMEMSPLDSVAYHQMMLQAGFLALDADNGAVLAYIGGVDHAVFPYDHVRAPRQVGSTFKPFVYAAAIDAGFSPCDYIENERIIFSGYDDWSPENSNGKYGGYYSLRGGLANSVNTVAARLIAETGPEAVADMAHRAGIVADLPKGPAISLGVANITLMEMVGSYAPFANGGYRIAPHYIASIATAEGEVIYEAPVPKKTRAMDEETALTMLHMLEGVVDSGTARSMRSAYGVRIPLAGKTGTTQRNADGWFIACTPGVVCGAWVGGASPLVRFRSTALGQGAATAMPIVAGFLRKAEVDQNTAAALGRKFPDIPASILLEAYCPMYRESKGGKLFDSLFDKETRQEKRELRRQAREERRDDDDGEKEGGWIKRLFKKLKKDR